MNAFLSLSAAIRLDLLPFFFYVFLISFFSLATMRPLISDLCTCTLPRAGRVSLTISSGWRALSPVYYLVAVACFVQKKKEKESRIVFL
jgi:predicted membrane channel-forming protein YqfA (hemolysin III family)